MLTIFLIVICTSFNWPVRIVQLLITIATMHIRNFKQRHNFVFSIRETNVLLISQTNETVDLFRLQKQQK